jgi:hypothetical protein
VPRYACSIEPLYGVLFRNFAGPRRQRSSPSSFSRTPCSCTIWATNWAPWNSEREREGEKREREREREREAKESARERESFIRNFASHLVHSEKFGALVCFPHKVTTYRTFQKIACGLGVRRIAVLILKSQYPSTLTDTNFQTSRALVCFPSEVTTYRTFRNVPLSCSSGAAPPSPTHSPQPQTR